MNWRSFLPRSSAPRMFCERRLFGLEGERSSSGLMPGLVELGTVTVQACGWRCRASAASASVAVNTEAAVTRRARTAAEGAAGVGRGINAIMRPLSDDGHVTG